MDIRSAGEQEAERGAASEIGRFGDDLGETGRMGEKIRACEGVFSQERESERAGELYRAGRVAEQMGERAEADLFGKPEGQGFDERADRASGIGRHAVEIERKSIKLEIRQRMYKHFFKRFMDIVISLLALIALSPLLLILAIAVKIDSPGPVVFKQQRIGRKGKVFNIYKFRSMCVGAEKIGSGVYSGKGDKRVTKVGNFLRKTSADELLQLVNMLKGDMSLIGPRPPLTYHPWPYEQYTEEQKRMFEVRPGITGWAQVNGRKEVEWHDSIELKV